MERKLLVNQIMTPDGTIIRSNFTHDYVTHIDKNGLEYMVDGGLSYLRRNVYKVHKGWFVRFVEKIANKLGYELNDPSAYKEMSIYDDSPFEDIRRYVERGGRGKDGKQPLKYVVLKDIGNEWLQAIIEYEEEHRPNNRYLKLYKLEVTYRKNEKI